MLIQPDIHELGDKRLDPKENVAKEREDLLRNCARNRIGGQNELEDPERSGGPRLSYNEVIRKLRRAIPNIRIFDGAPGSVSLYVPCNRAELAQRRLEWDWTEGRDPMFMGLKYVGGFPKTDIPEFSHVLTDSSNLPTREVRGWRSVLISLLKQGCVSYRTVVREFGEALGYRGWRWQEQTRPWRFEPDTKFEASSLNPVASCGWGNQVRS